MKYLIGILFGFLLSSGAFAQTSVEIPNVFTPDGDGVNDRFFIKTTGYEKLTCNIYNRHGEIIYRFHGLEGSWDGYTHAGVKAAPGVYFIYLQLTTEGSDDAETWQGTLQLLWR